MRQQPNPRQLVLRRDSATGMTLVGWASDLPVGRFEHLELIGESAHNTLPEQGSQYFASYQSALRQARQANCAMLDQQVRHYRCQGWQRVPFELARDPAAMQADSVGSFAAAAMQLLYQLTQNRTQAWVSFKHETMVHVRPRYPRQALDELTYQVWYHRQLQELQDLGGHVTEGSLVICESGLWFAASQA